MVKDPAAESAASHELLTAKGPRRASAAVPCVLGKAQPLSTDGRKDVPAGIGLGLRYDLARELIDRAPSEIAWVELHPENYLRRGGAYRAILDEARERWPIVTHGLTLCLGNESEPSGASLAETKNFLQSVGTRWHSEHLCFGGDDQSLVHDLLPLPFTEEALSIVVTRFNRMRDAIDCEFAFENVSYYAPQSDDGLDEARFCAEILERTDGKILLDVNNVFVNSKNFSFDPRAYIDLIPTERIVQLHVAGHFIRPDGVRIDTHGEQICRDVFELLEYTLERTGPIPTLLERDNNIPPLDELLREVQALQTIYERATKRPREPKEPSTHSTRLA